MKKKNKKNQKSNANPNSSLFGASHLANIGQPSSRYKDTEKVYQVVDSVAVTNENGKVVSRAIDLHYAGVDCNGTNVPIGIYPVSDTNRRSELLTKAKNHAFVTLGATQIVV